MEPLPGVTGVRLIYKKAHSPRPVFGDPEYTRAGALRFVTYCVTGSLLIFSWLLGLKKFGKREWAGCETVGRITYEYPA
ncbi:MAG TPA: hypothetical protein GX507_04290 [Clostridia bacterium]|nr:hypothetical protein [Clostridia bacterium]